MRLLFAALVLAASNVAGAQRDTTNYIIKTIQLHRLSSLDAMSLVNQYVAGRGFVSPATGIHAITVRASPAAMAEVEKVLAQYDRSPANLTLTFQLVAADYTNRRDPGLAGLDSLLSRSLKYTGYHLMASTVASATEETNASISVSGEGEDYVITYGIGEITGEGAGASAHLTVRLGRRALTMQNGVRGGELVLLSTGVVLPDDHTVVLGGASETTARSGPEVGQSGGNRRDKPPRPFDGAQSARNERAIFLVVRAQISQPTKRD